MIAEVSLAKSKEIKKIEVEDIKKSSEFLKSKLLTKAEVKKAIEDAICQIDANMEYFKDKFPWSATKQNKYEIIEKLPRESTGKAKIEGATASGEGLVNVYRGTGKLLLAPVDNTNPYSVYKPNIK